MRALIYISIAALLLWNCQQKESNQTAHEHQHALAEKYTCPMHPQIIRDAPGSCPICGMDLVPISQVASQRIMLNDTQLKLANITTERVSAQSVGETSIIYAKLAVDESLSEVISSRAAGRIERLFIKETGRTVKAGEPLYELYSENLLTLQREYLLAKEQFETLGKQEPRYESFLKASERKLLLYGLTARQIAALAQAKSPQSRITFIAPAGGIVTEINVTEGQYLAEGSPLYKIENTDRLWVAAELYPQETTHIRMGDKVRVRISGFENIPIEATVTFLSPEYRANTQIIVMRAELKNTEHQYVPGMQAQVLLTNASQESLALPTDAVIRDGKGTHVYIQSGSNTFEQRTVKTGIEDFDKVQITEGLQAGDTVVVTGAYLLYSEMVLKRGG
ncbi:MAG TPA: efflux RND transporter periplasmic adaptor subunit [Ohtaekwangia sp.]|uniref:efflux RND transporter periplasmic adaptor subunit n=1 Tax=Ohtaekwangia sp. TaxID=2066019 RepID=UPI002F92CB3C